jgi:hypothetical protein
VESVRPDVALEPAEAHLRAACQQPIFPLTIVHDTSASLELACQQTWAEDGSGAAAEYIAKCNSVDDDVATTTTVTDSVDGLVLKANEIAESLMTTQAGQQLQLQSTGTDLAVVEPSKMRFGDSNADQELSERSPQACTAEADQNQMGKGPQVQLKIQLAPRAGVNMDIVPSPAAATTTAGRYQDSALMRTFPRSEET